MASVLFFCGLDKDEKERESAIKINAMVFLVSWKKNKSKNHSFRVAFREKKPTRGSANATQGIEEHLKKVSAEGRKASQTCLLGADIHFLFLR